MSKKKEVIVNVPKKNKIRNGSVVADVIIYAFMAVLSFVFLYPLYQVLVNSISDPGVVATKNGLLLWPKGVHFDAYRVVFANKNIWIGFKNTVVYMVLGTCFQYLITQDLINIKSSAVRILAFGYRHGIYGDGHIPAVCHLKHRIQAANRKNQGEHQQIHPNLLSCIGRFAGTLLSAFFRRNILCVKHAHYQVNLHC